jgi:hypothetical protein
MNIDAQFSSQGIKNAPLSVRGHPEWNKIIVTYITILDKGKALSPKSKYVSDVGKQLRKH